MEKSAQNIFECLQLSEEIHLTKLDALRSVEEELENEHRRQNQLKAEVKEAEEEVYLLQEEQLKLELQFKVKSSIQSQINEKLAKLDLDLEESNKHLGDLEMALDDVVEDFIESVHDFHESVRLDTTALIDPRIRMREKTEQLSLEEDVLRCELKVRQDLENEVKFLEAKLRSLTTELKDTELKTSKNAEDWDKKIDDALRRRNEFQDPKNQPEIRRLEEEIVTVEQDNEFLMAALDAMRKELGKRNASKRFSDNSSFLMPKQLPQLEDAASTSAHDVLPFSAQKFTRNLPQPSPSPVVSSAREIPTSPDDEGSTTEVEEESIYWKMSDRILEGSQKEKPCQDINKLSASLGHNFDSQPPRLSRNASITTNGADHQQTNQGNAQTFTRGFNVQDNLPSNKEDWTSFKSDQSKTRTPSEQPKRPHTSNNENTLSSGEPPRPAKFSKSFPSDFNPKGNMSNDKGFKFKFRKSTMIHVAEDSHGAGSAAQSKNASNKPQTGSGDKLQKVRFSTFCEVMGPAKN